MNKNKDRLWSVLTHLEKRMWEPAERTCPKCNNATVEYYDPFFFSPIRTLKGKRRLKCTTCQFVWRPSS